MRKCSNRITRIIFLGLALLIPQAGKCFYNPNTGHWLSRDPVGEEGGINVCGFAGNDLVSAVDTFGLWTTIGHNLIIDYWLRNRPNVVNCGCCKIRVKQLLKNASAQTDGFIPIPGLRATWNLFGDHSYFKQQSVARAAEHGMGSYGENRDDTELDRDDVVDSNLAAAEDALSGGGAQCKARKDAIKHIGYAYHAISDTYSPSHDLQPWQGVSQSVFSFGAVTHVWHETQWVWKKWPEEQKDAVANALSDRLADALDQALKGCENWK